ncbi:hypothetical protein [Deinococcus budaensis]|uniref:Uncharacterized protein n=1 Tax=Deinococcus budaensis TaxID=1665626 RepID=A0A7W8GFJ6_9DEIO|nr:hypothetical protein [Deinococcus budaensis]MBB5234368.1 hypothetical protein [Deinococcus budaensis]
MKRLGMCLNWEVAQGLAIAVTLCWTVFSVTSGAALPFLLAAACPLSMLWIRHAAPPLAPASAPGLAGSA